MQTPMEMLDRIYDEDFGVIPTNFSIKPVHVANGLARALMQRSYKSTALAESLRRWVRNQKLGLDEERNPNTKILDKFGEAFGLGEGREPDLESLNALRSLARDVLGADGAVFDDPDKSSYTMANERFITKDPSDHRTGLFLSRLLTAGEDGDAAARLREMLSSETDPWTTLALPLLGLAAPRDEVPDQSAPEYALNDHLFQTDDGGRLSSPALGRLRESYDRLARFEAQEGSKLNSLRRMMLFGCFVVHAHLLSRWSEAIPGSPRPPILLDLFDGTRPSIRDASRATVRGAGDAVEGLLAERVRGHLAAEVGSQSEIDAALEEMADAALKERYEVHLQEDVEPVAALAEAYLELGIERTKGHPIAFLTELGRRAGYLAPWANQGRGGRQMKRYGVTAEFLETLIAATVAPDEPLEFAEFLNELEDTFGIVVGRAQDDSAIRRNNLNDEQFGSPISISEEDLRLNVAALKNAVEATGYAKSYADGRTIVTTAPEDLVTV